MHVNRVLSQGFLDCDIVWNCGRIPTFQSSMLPASSDRFTQTLDVWTVGVLLQHYTASQPRRTRLKTSPPWKSVNSHYVTGT